MATYQIGGGRSFFAGDSKVNVNRNKFTALSEADEALYDAIVNCKSYSEEIAVQDLMQIEEKALLGYGTQANGWQPTTLGGQIVDLIRAKSKVRNFHPVIQATSDPYKLPVNLSNFTASIVGEGNSPGISKSNQADLTFTHKKIMIETEVSSEFEEDSVAQSMQFIKELLATNLMEAEEDLLFVNHATDGMVVNALDKTADFTAVFNAQNVMDLLMKMPTPYNLDPSNMVVYLHPTLYWKLVQSGDVKTVDAFGPQATVVTGELGKYFGMSIAPLVSLKSVGTSPVKYPMIIANRNSVLISQRRNINIRVFPIDGDKNKIEATIRTAVKYPHGNNGVIKANFA